MLQGYASLYEFYDSPDYKENYMNESTKKVIAGLLSLVNPALGVISTFVTSGSKAEKMTNTVKDAVKLVTAVVPVLDQWGNGKEVTAQDVETALAGFDAEREAFKAEIAAQGG